jgi:hypothetical protein
MDFRGYDALRSRKAMIDRTRVLSIYKDSETPNERGLQATKFPVAG